MKKKKKKKDKYLKEEVEKIEEEKVEQVDETEVNEDESIDESVEESETEEVEEKEIEEEEDLFDDDEEPVKEEPQRFISTKNYDDEVIKLIDEVKIFSDDSDDLGFKRRRRFLPTLLLFIILIGIGVAIYFIFIEGDGIKFDKKDDNKKEENNKVEEKVTYKFEKSEDGIVFYANEDIINTYECEDCEPYAVGRYEYFSTDPTVLAISNKESIFLYDYVKGEVISEEYTQLKNLKQEDKTVAFIVSAEEGAYGVINTQGEVIIPLEYENLGYSTSGGDVTDYSYEKDILTAQKDGNWGVINFKGKEIIPFEYEDIYYNGYDCIVVCIEGLWYLYDLENNNLIEDGYDIMIPIKSYVFVSVENVFSVLNYKGESIIEKEIPTYLGSFRSRERSITPTFKIEEDGTVVIIYIMKDDKEYSEYKFNTVNGELTEIIQ